MSIVAPGDSRATHADLVGRAVRWLRRSRGCSRVLAEFVSVTGEIPDAIGWRFGLSQLVEVKVSRADFRRDLEKPRHAYAEAGMGQQRWYFTPAGLVRPEELPVGWGLAEVVGRGVLVRVEPVPRERYDTRSELLITLSALRRHELGIPWDASAGRFAALTDPAHPSNARSEP